MSSTIVSLKSNSSNGYDVIEEKDGIETLRKSFSTHSTALDYVNKNYGSEVKKNIEPAPYRSPRP